MLPSPHQQDCRNNIAVLQKCSPIIFSSFLPPLQGDTIMHYRLTACPPKTTEHRGGPNETRTGSDGITPPQKITPNPTDARNQKQLALRSLTRGWGLHTCSVQSDSKNQNPCKANRARSPAPPSWETTKPHGANRPRSLAQPKRKKNRNKRNKAPTPSPRGNSRTTGYSYSPANEETSPSPVPISAPTRPREGRCGGGRRIRRRGKGSERPAVPRSPGMA
jgi:hypothetical protein